MSKVAKIKAEHFEEVRVMPEAEAGTEGVYLLNGKWWSCVSVGGNEWIDMQTSKSFTFSLMVVLP